MRKFFTYVTALCCAMCFSVSQVMADKPSDGATIKVAGTDVTSDNQDDVLKDGKVSYNPSSHTLTLNGVKLTSAITIDATNDDYDVTINVQGENSVSINTASPIWFKGKGQYDGLVISGDANASLSLKTTGAYCALQCSKTLSTTTEAELFPFTLEGGMKLALDNSGGSSTYGALRCHHFKFDQSNVSLRSPSSKTLIYSFDPSSNEGKKVMVIKHSDNAWDGYAYTSKYNVFVNGVEMCDGFPKNGEGFPCLTKAELPGKITAGYAAYDQKNKTLILGDGFTIAADGLSGESGVAALYFSDASANYTIKTAGSSEVSISVPTASITGIYSAAPLTLDLNGNNVKVNVSTSTTTAAVNAANDFTITDSSNGKKAVFTVQSAKYKGLIGSGSNTVTINSAYILIEGDGTTNASFSEVKKLTLSEDIQLASSADIEWNESKKAVCEKGKTTPTTLAVMTKFKPQFSSKAVPAAGGSVVAKDGETVVKLPYYHEDDKSLNLTATANEGYKFKGWKKDGGDGFAGFDSPTPISLKKGTSTTLDAWFGLTPKSDSKWFAIANDKWHICADKLQDDPTPKTAIESNISNAVYADGIIYYLVTNVSETGVFSVPFSGSSVNVLGKNTVVDMQSEYHPFKAFTYSENEDCFYAIAEKSSETYVLKIAMDGTKTELDKVTSTLSGAEAMAADADGNLLVFADKKYIKKYNISTKKIVSTSINENLPASITAAVLTIDPSDDAIYLAVSTTNGTDIYTVSPSMMFVEDWIWQMDFGAVCRGLFTTAKSSVPKYKITAKVKAGQEAMGSVSPASAKKKEGETVKFTVTANPGYLFDKWEDGDITDNPRTVTVGKEDKEYVATFKNDPDMYKIWVGGVQMGKTKSVLASGDVTGLTAGSISYDDAKGLFVLNNVTFNYTGSEPALKISNASKTGNYTMEIVGTCKISGAAEGFLFQNVSNLSITCNDAASLTLTGTDAIKLDKADLTIYGMTMTVTGSSHGIIGTKSEKLEVVGSTLSVEGKSDGSILELGTFKTIGCEMASGYEFKNNQVEKSGALAKDAVKFTPDILVTVTPIEKGSGTFTIAKVDAEGNLVAPKYTNTTKGWYKSSDKVMITATPAAGYAFGHWSDDGDWKDASKRKGANEREEKSVGSSGFKITATFYYKSQSSATWYGVNNEKFVSFRMKNYAEEVVNPTGPSAKNVKMGDYVKDSWYVLDGTNFKHFKFSSSDFSSTEELPKYADDADATSVSTAFTDMSYDIAGSEIYAVAGTALYQFNSTGKSFDKIGDFKCNKKPVTAAAIAVDVKKVKYILAVGNPGALYTVANIDTEKDTIGLKYVGDATKMGSIGMEVTNAQQSIAFDPETGELFWGAADYMRLIDMNEMTTHIVGDLGMKAGTQGLVKSMHRMARKFQITVKVASDQSDMGKVNITGKDDREANFVIGTMVTINAVPNPGYHFEYWKNSDTDDKFYTSSYQFKVTKKATFVAYFGEGEGIDEVQSEEVQCTKVLQDGQLYILRDDRVYNANGLRVK